MSNHECSCCTSCMARIGGLTSQNKKIKANGLLIEQGNVLLVEQIDQLSAELGKAREDIVKVVRGELTHICSYCGDNVDFETFEALREHIHKCSKHPLGKAEAENKRLREALGEMCTCKQWSTPRSCIACRTLKGE